MAVKAKQWEYDSHDIEDSCEEGPFSCYLCKYFFPGTWGSYYHPPEEAECTHDLAYRCAFLRTWPFKNGCKHHSKRESEGKSKSEKGALHDQG